jgi:hypothetical protein
VKLLQKCKVSHYQTCITPTRQISYPSPPVYDIPSFTTTNPFLEQAYTNEQLKYYKYLLQHQPFMRALMMSDPALALLVDRNNSEASLANPFGVPMLNPLMLYSPSLTSHINLLPGAVNNTPEMHTVSASSPLTTEDVTSKGEGTLDVRIPNPH